MHTMFVQVAPKCHRRGSAKGIEIFAMSSFLVDVDSHPVFTQSVLCIGIAEQQTGIVRTSICGKDPVETSHSTPNTAFYVSTHSCPKVVDDVSVFVDLDHVLELRIDHHGDRRSERLT